MSKREIPDHLRGVPATDLELCATPEDALDRLIALHSKAVRALAEDFDGFLSGAMPTRARTPVYPYLCVNVMDDPAHVPTLAFGKVAQPGLQGVTITAPMLFRAYLIKQLTLL